MYYFVYYEVFKRGWQDRESNQVSTGSSTTTHQAVINTHPLSWQLGCNEEYEKERVYPVPGYKTSERYTVISWQDLTEDEYETYKDQIG